MGCLLAKSCKSMVEMLEKSCKSMVEMLEKSCRSLVNAGNKSHHLTISPSHHLTSPHTISAISAKSSTMASAPASMRLWREPLP